MAKILRILIVDDERDMRHSISQWLTLSGYEAEAIASAEAALALITADFPGIVISDIKMPGMDGVQLLRKIRQVDPNLPVILITGHGDVPLAVEAMRAGAYDFVEKPFQPSGLSKVVKAALTKRRSTLDSRRLRDDLDKDAANMTRLIGKSDAMERIKEQLLDIGQTESPVLITGETGSGKTLMAHALHAGGARAAKPFVVLRASAYSEDDLNRLLFAPADENEEATSLMRNDAGTLVLEDVEAVGETTQAKLLHYLQTANPQTARRLICVANGEITLPDELRKLLRKDLYFQLSAHVVAVPPARSRGDDMLYIFQHYLSEYAMEYGVDIAPLSANEAANLLQAPWPGNIRQIMQVAEKFVLSSRRDAQVSLASLLIEDRPDMIAQPAVAVDGQPLKAVVESFEKMLIDAAMRKNRGSVAKVMEELQLPRRTLNEKMSKYGLVRSDYR